MRLNEQFQWNRQGYAPQVFKQAKGEKQPSRQKNKRENSPISRRRGKRQPSRQENRRLKKLGQLSRAATPHRGMRFGLSTEIVNN